MRRALSSALAGLLLGACAFGFAGGGLPPSIRTICVENFDNATSYPTLGQDVTTAIRTAMQSRLGLRSAACTQADAVVRGKVTRFDPDQPLAFSPASTPGQANQVTVTKRQVELSVDITVMEQATGNTIWEAKGQVVQGPYDQQQQEQGKQAALANLVTKVIDGVHSKW